jgi:Ribbon-helix-helix protein, copG family
MEAKMKKLTVRVSFTVPKGAKAKLKEKAKEQGISMSELIRRATDSDRYKASV